MNASGRLLLRGAGAPVELRVVDGGVAIEKSSVTVSVDSKIVRPDDWPPVASFCLERAPLPSGGLRAGDTLRCDFNALEHDWSSPRLPKVHGYFTFHALDVTLDLRVVEVHDRGVSFELAATTEEVDTYDERARGVAWSGEFWLPFRSFGEVWVPK